MLLPMEHDQNLQWLAIEPDTYRSVAPDPKRCQVDLEAYKLAYHFSIETLMRDNTFRLILKRSAAGPSFSLSNNGIC